MRDLYDSETIATRALVVRLPLKLYRKGYTHMGLSPVVFASSGGDSITNSVDYSRMSLYHGLLKPHCQLEI